MSAPGPEALGRGIVVDPGGPVPAPWEATPRLRVDEAVLVDPQPVVEALHQGWASRSRVVVELAVDPAVMRAPVTWEGEVHRLEPSFELWLDRLQFLVWANNYDGRGGAPVWWWGRKAARLGATVGGPADVVLADGTPAWVDGGPRAPVDVPDAVIHRESVELGRLTPARHRAPTAVLAADQLQAVAHAGGAARIIAPAGSGKTRVLTERLRHLVLDRGVERELVTAVAYNRRAADELEARTADLRPHVRTLHSLGLRILHRQARRTVVDERQVRRVLEDLVTVPRRLNTDPIAPYLEALAEVRLTLRSPEAVEADRDDVPGLADAFPRYRRRLADLGAVDFDEQIYGAVEILLRDPAARAVARLECRHLLVDEFQDLTPAFLLLIRLLAAPSYQVFGVGDDDQVIYGHAGADPAVLIDYERYFPGAQAHALEVNYRCPPAVVDAARTLLSYNHRRVDKAIVGAPGRAPEPDALRVVRHAGDRGAAEATSYVTAWHDAGVAWEEMAVLTRVNSILLPVQVALTQAGVPVRSTLGPEVLGRTGVRAALAYVRLAVDPDTMATTDLLEILRRPSRGLSRRVGDRLRRRGHWSQAELRRLSGLNDRDAERFATVLSDLSTVAAAAASGTTRTVLRTVRDDVGLGGAMSLLDSSRGQAEGSSHLDDMEALEQVAELHPAPVGFEEWLRSALERSGGAEHGCQLSTVHRVKGMEWPCVIVFGASAGLLPHRLAGDVEEERRVFHVALTRAARRVVVLADRARPSPFLDELTGAAPHRRPTEVAAAPVTARPKGPAPVTALGEDEERVFQALRAWRLARSRADGVAAFIVLGDEHLRGIARRRPRNLAELRSCAGIGPTKLERYGDDLLVALEDVG